MIDEATIHRAAVKWCGDKERETFNDDILYFQNNWKALPGLQRYVEREIEYEWQDKLKEVET